MSGIVLATEAEWKVARQDGERKTTILILNVAGMDPAEEARRWNLA